MTELLKINYENEQPTVSARDLHEFLEVKTAFKDWFPRMCEYGFINGEDFNMLKIERVQNEGGRMVERVVSDSALTIDMAKQICMLQRNDKGKQARQYFIQLEKKWNSPECIMERALEFAHQAVKRLEARLEEQKPLVQFAETAMKSDTNIKMSKMAKILCDEGFNTGEKRLFSYLRNQGILMQNNIPYQTYIDRKYFVLKETPVNINGDIFLRMTTLVTPKGQLWIVSKIKEEMESK